MRLEQHGQRWVWSHEILRGYPDGVVTVFGLSPRLAGEEAADSDADGDRGHLRLAGVREALLKELHPMVSRWCDSHRVVRG